MIHFSLSRILAKILSGKLCLPILRIWKDEGSFKVLTFSMLGSIIYSFVNNAVKSSLSGLMSIDGLTESSRLLEEAGWLVRQGTWHEMAFQTGFYSIP